MTGLSGKHICLVCHPYTARKDIGAGGDRYAYELARFIKPCAGRTTVMEAGIVRNLPTAIIAELGFQLRWSSMKADLYHAVMTVCATSALRQRKKPLVTTIHDLISLYVNQSQDRKWKFWYKSRCIKNAAAASDMIIVPFFSTKAQLIDDLKVKEEKIRVVHYGVDHEQFYPAPKVIKRKRKVLFVGALNKGKGVDSLVLCWDQVIDKYKDVELVLASKGWDSNYIKNLIAQTKNKDSIKLIGFIPEDKLRKAYLDADIAIFPSRYGFGLPTLEAMACGTPTISGNTLDAPEFVQNAGLLVNPDNLEDLSSKILCLLSDDSKYKDLVQKGIERSSHFHWKKTASDTMKVYEELL